MEASGTLSRLCVSFSRQEAPPGAPRYVQDNLRLNSVDVVRLVDEAKASIYVCGDAKNMARDVNETLAQILAQEKGNKKGNNFLNLYRVFSLTEEFRCRAAMLDD